MSDFQTQDIELCNKSGIKIKEYANGWYFYVGHKHLNTIEAYSLWSTYNQGNIDNFKCLVNSVLKNPDAMKY